MLAIRKTNKNLIKKKKPNYLVYFGNNPDLKHFKGCTSRLFKEKIDVGFHATRNPFNKGSSYNVMVEWEDGSKTYEPLAQMIADDPVTCALYAKEQGLLNQPGWKSLKGIAKRDKKMIRMLNQSKYKPYRRAPTYKNGYQVPRTPEDAIEIDNNNTNIRWQN